MARFTPLFVLTAMLVVVCCHPFRFGRRGRARSHTTIDGEGSEEVGEQHLAAGRGKGFLNLIEDTGYQGYGSLSVGGGVGGKTRTRGTLGTDDGYIGNVGDKGSLDADGHASIYGYPQSFDAKEIKRINRKNTETYHRAFARNNQEERKEDYDW